MFAEWNQGRRDFDDVREDVELHTMFASVHGVPYQGHEGMRRWMDDIDEQFEEWQLQADRWETVGEERYVAIGRVIAKGRSSGVEIDWPLTWLFELEGGQLRRMTVKPGSEAVPGEGPLEREEPAQPEATPGLRAKQAKEDCSG